MKRRIVVEGELHLTLDAVAECYRVDLRWLLEVYDQGLLGSGRVRESQVVISVTQLDRVAQIVRLHDRFGLDLVGIAAVLGVDEPDGGSVSYEP